MSDYDKYMSDLKSALSNGEPARAPGDVWDRMPKDSAKTRRIAEREARERERELEKKEALKNAEAQNATAAQKAASAKPVVSGAALRSAESTQSKRNLDNIDASFINNILKEKLGTLTEEKKVWLAQCDFHQKEAAALQLKLQEQIRQCEALRAVRDSEFQTVLELKTKLEDKEHELAEKEHDLNDTVRRHQLLIKQSDLVKLTCECAHHTIHDLQQRLDEQEREIARKDELLAGRTPTETPGGSAGPLNQQTPSPDIEHTPGSV